MSDFRTWDLGAAHGDLGSTRDVSEALELDVLASVERSARLRPDAVAVRSQDGDVTYLDLVDRARAVRDWLGSTGHEPGSTIALCADKRAATYITLLGAWAARCVVAAIDADAPLPRLRALIERSGARTVLATSAQADDVVDEVDNILLADRPAAFQGPWTTSIEALPVADRPLTSGPGTDVAYVSFTSGSTGAPKGVEIEQRSVRIFCHTMVHLARTTQDSIVAQGARLCFDAAYQQILAAFGAGAALVPVPDDLRLEPGRFADWLREERITHLDSVPSLWSPLVRHVAKMPAASPLPHLQLMLIAGEAPRPHDVRSWMGAVPQARLVNAYGPTEATVNATAHEVSADDPDGIVPAGCALPGVRLQILDSAGHECPAHVEGEVVLSGPMVARGYRGDPTATAKAFTTQHEGGTTIRTYRTGDLGYLTRGGELVCTGRRDSQLKVNGVRVEAAEVEAVLTSLHGVRDAAVTVLPTPAGGRLLAAVVASDLEDVQGRVREAVLGQLPAAFVPSRILSCSRVPRLPSGKLDQGAVLRLHDDPLTRTHMPKTTVARSDSDRGSRHLDAVLAVCRDVLGPALRAEDDLFAHGLDSISVLRVRAGLSRAGLDVSVREVFASRSVIALSHNARPVAPVGDAPTQDSHVPQDDHVRLLPAQRSILMAGALSGRPSVGLVQECHVVLDRVDPGDAERAFSMLVEETEVLRVSFQISRSGEITQHVTPPTGRGFAHQAAPDEGFLPAVERILDDDLAVSVDIDAAPLVRLRLVVGSDRSALLWTMHHAVTDGWSFELLSRRFGVICAALRDGRPVPPRRVPPSLRQLAEAVTASSLSEEEMTRLRTASQPLPITVAAPSQQEPATAAKRAIGLSLGPPTSARLDVLRAEGVGLSAVVLYAVARSLRRVTRADSFAVGLVVSGRGIVPGDDYVVAPLATVVPFTLSSRESSLPDLQRRVHEAAVAGAGDLEPSLVSAGVPPYLRSPALTVLVQNYDSGLRAEPAPSLRMDEDSSYSRETASSGLAVVARREKDSVAVRLEYWPDLVEDRTARALLRELQRALKDALQ